MAINYFWILIFRDFRRKFITTILVFVGITYVSYAQWTTIHHPQLHFVFEDSLLKSDRYHSVFKPIEIPWLFYDSVMQTGYKSKNNIRVTPILNAFVGYEREGRQFLWNFAQGIYTSGLLGRKAGFELSVTINEEKFPSQYGFVLDSLNIVPGHNKPLWNKNLNTGYLSVRGHVFWKPNNWLTLKAGNDKHFIGDGARSFLLSENAAAMPFFQTRVNVWKINYAHQLLFMSDVIPDSGKTRYSKYATLHTLSFNATPKLNFYIFEAVIWRAQDSIRQRNFDVMYLNPFLFFRPVEFNMGSPDNVLMGIGGKWIFGKRSFIYGQILLDEFRLKEIKANKGWWANKYAYQAGIKTYGLFKRHKSYLLAEYNHCRPFTYSHTRTLQNYGYLYRPLAHPQGSNFREIILQFGIELPHRWYLHSVAGFINYGTDSLGTNFGSDIYKPQYTYSRKYGNQVAQGISHTELNFGSTLSYMLKPSWRLRIFAEINAIIHKTSNETQFLPAINFGLNTWLYD